MFNWLRFFFSECRCNPYGSLRRSCNIFNGQCLCRENVVGRSCDKCAEGFWNLESSKGCQSCQCNVTGSSDLACSSHTAQCNCKPGVGGLTCDGCLDGFYGFSANGCKRKWFLFYSRKFWHSVDVIQCAGINCYTKILWYITEYYASYK